jgi:hypothetical protein
MMNWKGQTGVLNKDCGEESKIAERQRERESVYKRQLIAEKERWGQS